MASTNTGDKAFSGWEIVTPQVCPTGPCRYRVDRLMLDQSPPVEYEGHFDTVESALRHGNTFDVNNADQIRVRDLKRAVIVARRVFG